MSGNPYSYNGITSSTGAAISNFGQITAASGGSVFLIGPNVENYGSIDAKLGQIGLAAGTQVSLIAPTVDPNATGYQRTALLVEVMDGFGEAVNREGGQLTADEGMVGMYGGVVNQDGLIRSVTAVNYQGRIELVASDKIITGSNSIIESPISTSSDKSATSTSSFGGVVNMSGNFANPEAPRYGAYRDYRTERNYQRAFRYGESKRRRQGISRNGKLYQRRRRLER